MKKLLILSLLIASMVFAASTSVASVIPVDSGYRNPEILVNNVYDFGTMVLGLPCYDQGGLYTANDFETGSGSTNFIEGYTIWVAQRIFSTDIDSMFYDEDVNGPGSLLEIVSGVVESQTYMNEELWETYDIHEYVVAFDSAYAVTPNTRYWMVSNPVDGLYYWLTPDYDGTWGAEAYYSEDGGTSWAASTSFFGSAYDCFWVMEGTTGSAIEETTWGQIKAM